MHDSKSIPLQLFIMTGLLIAARAVGLRFFLGVLGLPNKFADKTDYIALLSTTTFAGFITIFVKNSWDTSQNHISDRPLGVALLLILALTSSVISELPGSEGACFSGYGPAIIVK
jgi:hypothetical protein